MRNRDSATKANAKQTKTKRVKLNLHLHPIQREVKEHPARFKVWAAGRQTGKSRLAAAVSFEAALKGKQCWWVAPDYPLAMIGWRLIRSLAQQLPEAEIRESERILTLPGGGVLQVKSAHSAGSLRGATLDELVVDEAAFIPRERWEAELRPTLAVKSGRALFISTFNGDTNWFYELYQRGQNPSEEEWASWRTPSSANPYISDEEIEEARRTLPAAVFEQEYLAEPLSYVGAVFEGASIQAAQDRGGAYDPRLETYAGVDWGFANSTTFELIQEDGEGRITLLDDKRWTTTELNTRVEAMADLCERYGVRMIAADAAGATENAALAATLKRRGLKVAVQRVSFGRYKDAAIETLRWYFENGMVGIAPQARTLADDLKRYHFVEGTDKPAKIEDHAVDGLLAFTATRMRRMVKNRAPRERA